jgi:hypothetical protein
VSEHLRALIVGGYGTFGRRIVGLLANEARLTLIVAGRSRRRAEEWCSACKDPKAKLLAAAFDRDSDLKAQLAVLQPDIVIDASGPFQAYGERRYRLIEAALAQGMSYLDLADGASFVEGVAGFDALARAKGLYVLSGVSSFPVLTTAALRRLAQGMTRIDAIRGGIAPSPNAEVGENVIRAIASYAGKPVPLVRDGALATCHSFTEHRPYTIAPPGQVPLDRRLFSLVDVPDLTMLAKLWPEVRDVWMGAAIAPEIRHRAFIALAWLVRRGLISSLMPMAPLLASAMRVLRWGEHRGGVFVEIEGADSAGESVRRSWHLVAEGDDGPYIPAMAVAAVIGRALDGRPPAPGARAGLADVELADYERLFSARAITAGIRQDAPPATMPLYARILNSAWRDLPAEIRTMHDVERMALAKGHASVERGSGFLARLAGRIIGFPPASDDVPVSVRFDVAQGIETWTRTFGDKSFHSQQFAEGNSGLICERFGPLTFAMALVLREGRLSLVLRHWRAFGIAMPMFLCPRSTAHETVEEGRFRFHVEIGHPVTGLIVRYRGWLELVAAQGHSLAPANALNLDPPATGTG